MSVKIWYAELKLETSFSEYPGGKNTLSVYFGGTGISEKLWSRGRKEANGYTN
jgi:hypothetical protein